MVVRRTCCLTALNTHDNQHDFFPPHSPQTWYALVANAEFFCNDVQNEALAEQLREKTRYYKEQNNDMDFFLIPNPTWLDAKFPEQGKLVKRPCMALVTPDKMWAE